MSRFVCSFLQKVHEYFKICIFTILNAELFTDCGRPSFSQRVVGGKNSLPGKWPWQVSVISDNTHLCGGSLISRSWVVTAAHCMGGTFSVMLGVLTLIGTSTTRVIVPVKTTIIHPIYSGDGSSGDLALLELERPVTFNNYIQPICLPSPDQLFPDGMMCWVTGWGNIMEGVSLALPYILQEVELPLINSSACDHMFKAAYNITAAMSVVQDDMICAGYQEGKKDSCQGDSGGPLACQFGNSWFLVGVVSWGDGCARPGEPGVYTKVSSFSAWIQENADLDPTSEGNINVTIHVNTFSTKKPTAAAKSFSSSKNIQEDTSGAAGQMPHVGAAGLMLLMFLIRTLDIM
ncbi:serine protease 33-like [Bufo bufo]|uniref:serine protease 33-like n=1 Tax=Bufo bufo TaxID=8384 RepID=UPI001ABE1C39|nr:serine protease 33-like [Bufo bufo]